MTRFGELGALGASTNVLTNMTTFPRVDMQADLLDIFRVGPAPERHLASFLHEATHHWCFHSTVMSSLALLMFEIRRQLVRLSLGEESREGKMKLLDRVSRFDATLECVRPISEGLACFAEFDAVPRFNTRLRSEPLNWAAMVFGMPKPDEPWEDTTIFVAEKPPDGYPDAQLVIDQWLLRLLGRLRTSEELTNRKAGILAQPLNLESGGYLVGYLFVKTLWDGMSRRVPRLRNETDLFFSYLRSFLFEDLVLVGRLLSPDTLDPTEAATQCLDRVDWRFEQLLDLNDQHVGAFEECIDGGDPSGSEFYASLMLTESEVDAGRTYIEESWAWWTSLEDEPATGAARVDEILRSAWSDSMSSRNLIYFGSTRGSVRIGDRRSIVELAGNSIDLTDTALRTSEVGVFEDVDLDLFLVKGGNGLAYRALSGGRDTSLVFLALLPSTRGEEELDWLWPQLARARGVGLDFRELWASCSTMLEDMPRKVDSIADARDLVHRRTW
ncbi:MAG TPA: hypothetical protein VHP35_08735, partial [Terriglobia bacterium]|nr:hypothetical protein [Terriglobia bacterium]